MIRSNNEIRRNHNMKRAIAFLSGLMLALQGAPFSAFAAEAAPYPDAAVPHLYEAPEGTVPKAAGKPARQAELPEQYDLRKLGLVSAVKNQSPWGTCWAHAVLACLETAGMPEDPHMDLSERYLATFVASDEYGNGANTLERGATAGAAMGLISNWIGLVSESIAPYEEEYTNTLSREELIQQTEYHVTDAHFLTFMGNFAHMPDGTDFLANLETAKRALLSGHALYMSLNFDSSAIQWDTNGLYQPVGEDSGDSPHAVTIVGYDDHFSADGFQTPAPRDGAWLIKNSWGTDSGNDGYYWVSYYDGSIDSMAYFDMVPAQAHDKLYSYDDFGVSGAFATAEDGDESVWISNAYTAAEDSYLTDVMLFCEIPGDQYEILVSTDLKDEKDPASGEMHAAAAGAMDSRGYRTVTLDEPVRLNAGDRFAVIAKLSGGKGYHIACEYTSNSHGMPVGFAEFSSGSEDSGALISEEKVMQTFGSGQSFFSEDGLRWTDLYDSYDYDSDFMTGNLCLRVITAEKGTVRFSSYAKALKPGTELSLSCADGKDIYYSVNGSEYKLYTKPLRFTKAMTVSAYVEGDEEHICTRSYDEKKAELSSLLIKKDFISEYADLSGDGEIVIPVYCSEITLLPITEGTVTDGETVTDSYEERIIPCGSEPFVFRLTAEEDGLEPTEYVFRVRKECVEQFAAGSWNAENERSIWYLFNEDGKSGFRVNSADEQKTAFTYHISDNIISMTEGDKVRNGLIASNSGTAVIEWEDGEIETWNLYVEGASEIPCRTYPELRALTETYFTELNGEAPEKVHVDSGDYFNVTITVTQADGRETVMEIDSFSAIGKDDSGNIINLNILPEKTDVTTFRPGIWKCSSEGGNCYYIYFDENGTDCVSFLVFNGEQTAEKYTLENGQLKFFWGDDETDYRQAAASVREDSAVVSWQEGTVENYTYFSDTSADEFSFLSDTKLMELASAYYETEYLSEMTFACVIENADGTVSVYHSYPDEFADESPYFCVDRFTGKGTDEKGAEVDLLNPPEISGTPFRSGIWKSTSEYDCYLNGYYWFSEDGQSAVFIDSFEGQESEMTFRMKDGRGIKYLFDEQECFTYEETEDGITIYWPDYDLTEYLSFLEPTAKEDFKFYCSAELVDMAIRDYKSRTGLDAEISALGYDEEGNARIHLVNPDTGEEVDVYLINPRTGKGTNREGKAINLPQTGITSPRSVITVFGALLMICFGTAAVMKSGVVRRRKDEQ